MATIEFRRYFIAVESSYMDTSYTSDLGEVQVWIEQDTSIHMKVVTGTGDPVELSKNEARRLAAVLLKYADRIDQ